MVNLDDMLDDTPPPARAAGGQEVSTAELADILGVSQSRISALAREGKLPRDSVGRFDLRTAVRAYCDGLRAAAVGRPSRESSAAVASAKARLTAAQAEAAELKAASLRGDLVPLADVRQAWAQTATDLRAALLAVPSRVAARLGMDRHGTQALDAEMRHALEGIADDSR